MTSNENGPSEMNMASGWLARRREKAARYKELVSLYDNIKNDRQLKEYAYRFYDWHNREIFLPDKEREVSKQLRQKFFRMAKYYQGQSVLGKTSPPEGMLMLDYGILKGRDVNMSYLLAMSLLQSDPLWSKFTAMDNLRKEQKKLKRELDRARRDLPGLEYHLFRFSKIKDDTAFMEMAQKAIELLDLLQQDQLPPDIAEKIEPIDEKVKRYEWALVGYSDENELPYADLIWRDHGIWPFNAKNFTRGNVVVKDGLWEKDGVEYEFHKIRLILAMWYFKADVKKALRAINFSTTKSAEKTEAKFSRAQIIDALIKTGANPKLAAALLLRG